MQHDINQWRFSFLPARLAAKVAKKCPDPGTPQYGRRMLMSSNIGSVVKYFCMYDFRLVAGDSQRTCLSSGKWSGKLPTCRCKLVHACTRAREHAQYIHVFIPTYHAPQVLISLNVEIQRPPRTVLEKFWAPLRAQWWSTAVNTAIGSSDMEKDFAYGTGGGRAVSPFAEVSDWPKIFMTPVTSWLTICDYINNY